MSLIGQQVFVAPGQVFSTISGGGGGGGGGTNLSVSTISVNPTGTIFLDAAGSQNAEIFGLANTTAGTQSTTSISVAFPSGYTPPGAGSGTGLWTIESQDQFNSSYYGDLCAGRYIVAGNNSGTGNELPWVTAGVNCDMTIHAASSINLQTSSVLVNGAPLSGGSVAPGANLTGLSTISVSSMTVTNGLLLTDGLAMSNTSIGFDTQGQAVQYYNAGNSNIYITGVSTASVKIGTQSNTNVISVEDTSLVVPNITGVSSINGSQPTNKSSYQISTLTGDTTYIPQNNVAWPLSGDIPVSAGHTYRITGNLALNNAGGSGYTTISVSGGAGFPAFLRSYVNAQLTPGLNGAAGECSGMVKSADGTPLQIVGYNSDTTASTLLQAYWPNWVVEDLGTNMM